MTREEQLQYCIVCKNRKMDNAKGLVCGLTNEYADFALHCNEFVEDEKITRRVELKKDPVYAFDYEDLSSKNTIESYSKMGWFVLLLLLGFATNIYLKYLWILDIDNQDLSVISIKSELVFPFLTILFIGIELKRIKLGFLASIAYLAGVFIFENVLKTAPFAFSLSSLLSVIPAFAILGFSFFNDIKKQLWFVLKSASFFVGILILIFGYLNLSEFLDYFNGIFSGDFRSSTFEKLNILDLTITKGEGRYSVFPLKYLFGKTLTSFLTYFCVISMYNQTIRNQKWQYLNLNLGNYLSKWKVALVVVVGYLGISMIASGIGSFVENFFRILSYSAYSNNESNLINNRVYVSFVLQIVLSFIALLVLVYHFRKFVLEYFLNHGVKVSWQYYFGFVPFVGIFVWIINLLTFKKAELSEQKLSPIVKHSNIVFISLYLASTLLYLIFNSLNPSNLGNSVVVIMLGGFLVLIFVYHKHGVYVNVITRFVLFALITTFFVSEGFDFGLRLSRNYVKIISFLMLIPIALQLLYHPIFHLSSYKVSLPKTVSEDVASENKDTSEE